MSNELVVYQIPWFPDISMARIAARYGTQAHRVVSERLFDVLMQMASLPPALNQVTFTLRYLVDATRTSQDRLNVFLLVSAECGDHPRIASFTSNLEMLRVFFPLQQLPTGELKQHSDLALALSKTVLSVMKQEEVLQERLSQRFYYAPKPFSIGRRAEVNALFWDELFDTVNTVPCMVDIALRPTALTKVEQAALMWLIRELGMSSSTRLDRPTMGSHEDLVLHDPLAERHRRIYSDYVDTIFSDLCFEYQIRVASSDYGVAARVAHAIGAELTGQGAFEVVEPGRNEASDWLHAIGTGGLARQHLDCQDVGPTCSYKLADQLTNLPQGEVERARRLVQASRLRLVVDKPTAREFLRLPVPKSGYLRTLRLETELEPTKSQHIQGDAPSIRENALWIGTDLERSRQTTIGVDQLRKHAFVAGVTGSGKTTSILNLLRQLWEDHGIPFLVLEPVKTEYRILKSLEGRLANDLEIYTLGMDHVSPFRFNPFCFGPTTTLSKHVSSLDLCFKGALPLVNPMPALIAEAIDQLYEQLGWQEDEVGREDRPYPSMLDLPNAVRKIMQERNYTGEVRQNIETAIDVRLGSLCRRTIGRIFSTVASVPSTEDLLSRPIILEMDSLSLEQTNLMCLFILSALREHLRARGPTKGLQHVLVLEEAHNLVGSNAREILAENIADPRGEATRFIVRMLGEVRALGEGMIIADHTPAAVAAEVVKGTNVKLVHRTVAGDDREVLCQAMLLDEAQGQELARLQPGEAYLYHEESYRPYKVLSRRIVTDDTRVFTDDELRERIVGEPWYVGRAVTRAETLSNFAVYWLQRIESYVPHWSSRIAELLRMTVASNDQVGERRRTSTARLYLANLNRALKRIAVLKSILSKEHLQLGLCVGAADTETSGKLSELLSRNESLESQLVSVEKELDGLCERLRPTPRLA